MHPAVLARPRHGLWSAPTSISTPGKEFKVTPIKGGRDGINYYASLVRQAQDDGDCEPKQRGTGHVEDYYLPPKRKADAGTARAESARARGSRHARAAGGALRGQHPETGEKLGQAPHGNSIRAYDLTFSAPKSVSLLATLFGGDAAERGRSPRTTTR